MFSSSFPPSTVVLSLLTLVAATGAVTFERPVRAAAAFLLAVLGTASLLHMIGAVELAGLLLWLLGAGVGLLLLTTILLLNLSEEEVGRRRLSVTRTVALLVVAWLAAALFAVIVDLPAVSWAMAASPAAPLGAVVFEEWGVALSLAFAALSTSCVAALLIVRRRA